MDASLQILIVAKPGHFRESLVAVLKTLPRIELFLTSSLDSQELEGTLHVQPTIALVDLNIIDGARLSALKERWPEIQWIAIVDHIHTREMRLGNFDAILPRGASTGELLNAILRLNSANRIPGRFLQAFPSPAIT
jgi:DNA-binding NarL/FixJ family response regulator